MITVYCGYLILLPQQYIATMPESPEHNRLIELIKYDILDSLNEVEYDDITRLASIICDVPIAIISFVDKERQWFKSTQGLDIRETTREYSFCSHAIPEPDKIMIVPDSRLDERFKNNPYVTGKPDVVFYAGMPLVTTNGYALGSVCVIDTKPRVLTDMQINALKALSRQVMTLLDARRVNHDLERAKKLLENQNAILNKTTGRLELAMSAGKLGSYELNINTGIMYASGQCRRNFGRNATEDFNLPELFSAIKPEFHEYVQGAIATSIQSGEKYEVEYKIQLPTGEERWIHALGIPVYKEDGSPLHMTGITSDITVRKDFTTELERQVTERTEKIAIQNSDLEKMNKELQAFTYISSHDLQEPLRKIQFFISLLRDKENTGFTDNALTYMNKIARSSEKMRILIADLLSYSRATTSERLFEELSFQHIMDEITSDLTEEIKAKQATINVRNSCDIKVIPFQFHQLVYNLVSNALKFSKPGIPPVINVDSSFYENQEFSYADLDTSKNYYRIVIADNGIGFNDQYNEKIFKPFQRLHSYNEHIGTGIGLTIVKKIVENHNGYIYASGQENEGATFEIFIPELN